MNASVATTIRRVETFHLLVGTHSDQVHLHDKCILLLEQNLCAHKVPPLVVSTLLETMFPENYAKMAGTQEPTGLCAQLVQLQSPILMVATWLHALHILYHRWYSQEFITMMAYCFLTATLEYGLRFVALSKWSGASRSLNCCNQTFT